MKSPEYVATVTKIYRKYIDLAMSNEPYIIDPNDKKELLQVFNRGMFSSGHFSNTPNKNLVFKDKPNHMGLFLGTVQKYNKNKGYITLKLKEPINIGDKVSVEKESGSYTISELMENKNNIRETKVNQIVTIGRIKGSISSGDKVYKISSKYITTTANESYKSENRKVSLNCNVIIKKSCPVTIKITSCNDLLEYKNLDITYQMPYIPEDAKNRPLDKETIIRQISKTNSTPYKFENIKIDLDENVYLPKLSILNELRRISLENVVDYAISQIHRTYTSPSSNINKNDTIEDMRIFAQNKTNLSNCIPPKISVLLNIINLEFDYSKLKNIDNLYIPLKYFINKKLPYDERDNAFKYLIKFDGIKECIKKYFYSLEEEYQNHILPKIIEIDKDILEEWLTEKLKSCKKTSKKMFYAKYLILSEKEYGLNYYLNWSNKNNMAYVDKNSYEDINEALAKINDDSLTKYLLELLKITFRNNFKDKKYNGIYNNVRKALINIASVNKEKSIEIVSSLNRLIADNNNEKYKNIGFINYIIEEIEQKMYMNKENSYNIKTIVSKIHELELKNKTENVSWLKI